ncbi:zinc finger protein 555-like [Schistocerca serialis cubense]|uniref:zinc finger protein 555-like n=1 Tax=Schistocerca serialis cubense TaxID=2023355 RepID=UPI00214F09CB|nr:zinc finger protein 555-like [Schistocerca serialis cubense]XP_049945373.1 zinc finger protein 555-like [Schistocerca serialis cubense]XP_049945374.1 zinc finger protein 555-like [Schistocerca serialis cubense]
MDSTKAVLDAILEAESDCCPPPSLVPREDVESMESEVQNDMKPVFALLVPLTPSEEPMVSSMGCAYDNIRLTENTGGSCGISFEESVNQGEVIDELGIGAEGSPHVSMCGSLTQGLLSQEDDSFSTRYNCSLEVKEVHEFSCSFCLQRFPSKYSLVMHVFIHIDGVQPPKHVCKSCGEVFPSNDSLNKHLKMSEGDKVLPADNDKTFDSSDDHENIIFLEGDRKLSIMVQTEKQSSSKECWKSSKKSFNDTLHTQTVTCVAEKPD